MPTGYTHRLHKGEPVTFEQFVLSCSRGMGAAIHQRDESSDVEISELTLAPDYAKNVQEAKDKLAIVEARTLEEWATFQEKARADALKYLEDWVAERAAVRERYEAMLKKVRAWVPPSDEHDGLKKFMTEQLQESIRFDCGSWVPTVPALVGVLEYANAQTTRALEDLADAYDRLRKEQARVASQNAWVRMLRESLENL